MESTPHSKNPARDAARRLLPPLSAFLLARALLLGAALLLHRPPVEASTWMRWDSGQYAEIAARGYEIHPCAAGEGVPGSRWCGDAGWFPLYPFAAREISALGLPIGIAGLLVSALAAFAGLLVLWNEFLLGRPNAFAALLAAAFFPGMIYGHAFFPMSVCVFFILIWLSACRRFRPWTATLTACATALSYPIGAALCLVGAIAFLSTRERARRMIYLLSSFGAAIGAMLVLCIQRRELGIWDAWFRVQEMSRYHGWSSARLIQMLYVPIVMRPTALTKAAVLSQSAAVAALIAASVAFVLRQFKEPRNENEWLLIVFALVFWVAPHVSGYRQSYYRGEYLLLPAAALLPKFPSWAARLFAFLFFVVALPMAVEFIAGRLV